MVKYILIFFIFASPIFAYTVGEQVVLSGVNKIQRGNVITPAGTYTVEAVKVSQGYTIVKINGAYVSQGNMQYISTLLGYTQNAQLIEVISFASGSFLLLTFVKGLHSPFTF